MAERSDSWLLQLIKSADKKKLKKEELEQKRNYKKRENDTECGWA